MSTEAKDASKRVVVTGASSGIGAATARRLQSDGWSVIAVARRADRLAHLAAVTGAEPFAADLTDRGDIDRLAAHVAHTGGIQALVNNAGGAIGTDSVEHGKADDWLWMYRVNVLATQQVTAALLPSLRQRATAQDPASIVTMTSTAGHGVYEGGGGYNAAKFGEAALVGVLRLELAGEPIRVIEISPGMVRTDEFSVVRYRGDTDKADAVYQDVPGPLVADDVADVIAYTLGVPPHVNIDHVVMRPVAQAANHKLVRGELTVRTD